MNMKHYIWITILFFFVAFASAQTGFAQTSSDERITRFHADIVIDADGRVEVTEHITYHANGKEFRGITRAIPQTRQDGYGKIRSVPITLLTVMRDGEESPYLIDDQVTGDLFIKVGSVDVFLPEGDYAYVIKYESYGHVGFFDEYDEIYWNVTGNGTEVPIDDVSATVTLPADAEGIQAACYTGVKGSTEQNCTFEAGGNRYTFEAGRPLAALEGLTIAVAFPRDIISRAGLSVWDKYGHWIVMGVGGLMLLLFAGISWMKVGRDARKPVVYPTFKPPFDWSPAEVRYVYKHKFDAEALSSTLLNTAINGGVRIVPDAKNEYSFAKGSLSRLTHNDGIVYKKLFDDGKESVLFSGAKTKFASIYASLEGSVKAGIRLTEYFKPNVWLMIIGGVMAYIAILVYWCVALAGDSLYTAIGISITAGVGVVLTLTGKYKHSQGEGFSGMLYLCGGIFALLICIYSLIKIDFEGNALTLWGFPFCLVVLGLVYCYLIPGKSKKGAEAEAAVEGFRMYMKTAEEHRLNILTPPDRTPELFEKLLPYAVALGVENEWCDKFTSVLQAAAYRPDWYPADRDALRRKAALLAMARRMKTHARTAERAVNAAKSASGGRRSGSGSWSSGSGGGGRSGGGGGGGRVGRW